MPPKTASNSIKLLLEQNGYIFSKDSKSQNYPQIHLKLSEIVEQYNVDNVDDYKIVQIIRDPYQRYVSSFFFQKKIVPNFYTPKFKGFGIEEFTTHLYESKKSDNFIKSFYGDTSFVDLAINAGIGWGGSRLFDTQLGWNDLGLNVSYFKLEDMNDSVGELGGFLNLNNSKLPTVNSQNLTFDYMSLISPNIKEIIIELFDEDFEPLGYKK